MFADTDKVFNTREQLNLLIELMNSLHRRIVVLEDEIKELKEINEWRKGK